MGALRARASAEIDAPPERVWALVADVESYPAWQRGIEAMRALEHDDEGRVALAETESDAKVKVIRSRMRFAYEPPRRLSWRQERGDMKSMAGSWELEDLGDGRTRATYAMDADPGAMLGMLLRGPVEQRMREILVDARPAELKARAEGG